MRRKENRQPRLSPLVRKMALDQIVSTINAGQRGELTDAHTIDKINLILKDNGLFEEMKKIMSQKATRG